MRFHSDIIFPPPPTLYAGLTSEVYDGILCIPLLYSLIYFIGGILVSSLSRWSIKLVRSPCVMSCATIWIYILLHPLRAMWSLLLLARWYFLLPNILFWISNEALSLLNPLLYGNWVELIGIPGNLAMVELPSPTLGPWGYVIFRDIGDILEIIILLVEPT